MPPDGVVECEECLEDEEGRRRIGSLPDAESPEADRHAPETSPTAEPDALAGMLELAAMAEAVLAARMGLPRDQVSVHVAEDGSIAGGSVILAPSDIEKMIRDLTK